MSMTRPGQTAEALAEEMCEQGKITRQDVDEIAKFTEFLRMAGPFPEAEKRPVAISAEWAEYVGLKEGE